MKSSSGEKKFYALNYFILVLGGLACLLPIIHIAALSLSDSISITTGNVSLWPVGWTGYPIIPWLMPLRS